MILARHGLDTKLARRVLGLFLLCAVVPLAVVLFASYGRVQNALVSERDTQLGQAAEGYGTTLLERFYLAEQLARSLAPELSSGRSHEELRRHFLGAVVYPPDGAPVVLMDGGSAPPAKSSLALRGDHLATGASQVVVADGPRGREVWLLRHVAYGNARDALLGVQLNGTYLWGDADELPYATSLCVLDDRRRALHCTETIAPSALEKLRDRLERSPAGQVLWEDGGARQRASFREVFLEPRFRGGSWPVVLWQAEEHALAPIDELRRILVPMIIFALLAAALMGLVQVRRIMNPLKQLLGATQRIGDRDFGTRVDVRGDDEFHDLAEAFNGMSERLGRQFHALGALAQIDSVILSKVDFDRIGAIVVGRMREVVRGRAWMLLLPEESQPGRFLARTADSSAGSLTGREFGFSARELEILAGSPQGVAMGPHTPRPTMPALIGIDPQDLFALPIVAEGAVRGLIVVGGTQRGGPDAEEVRLLQDLGDRVAVALATASRDRELYRRAHFDPLTQLPNRQLFLDELKRELARAERHGTKAALLFIDLDGFSAVNDTLGHAVGDDLLVHVAARLRGCMRKSDLVARLGGDEFTVVVSDVREPSDVAVVAQHLIDVLSQPYDVGYGDTFITASIGIALYPTDGTSAQELLQHSDMAMYRAKERGRGQHAYFEEAMNREAQQRFLLDRELRHALEVGQFVLHYQPQLDLAAHRITGAEALLRWQHPTRGLVAPGPFIGFAEESGLIDKIGEWVLHEACRQFVRWRAAGLEIDHVSVNVSPRQFRGRDFVETVARALDATTMSAEHLRLEITENVLVDDSGQADATLARLRVLGTPLELDDFGTGYSSLAYLQRLPVETIKLDRSFVMNIGESDNARAIAKAAIDMVHALKKQIVAEGVETKEQLALLRKWGCDAIQGYLLSRPLPPEQFVAAARGGEPRAAIRLVHGADAPAARAAGGEPPRRA
jgi:diguanylate cyclase (GGDEF)-like protein